MKTKEVERILAPPATHWVGNGFKVHNFFPYLLDEQRMSPFFLLDYNAKMFFPPSDTPQGVGSHPHRGIETVTVAYYGKVAHHDSTGNGGVISEGDLQWMTAGGGILHKEYHEKEFNKSGGDLQMAQIWINLPQKAKWTPPKYQTLMHEHLPKFQLPGDAGVVEVIAGNYQGLDGIASTFSPIEMYNIKLKDKGQIEMNLPSHYNTGILLVQGSAKINDNTIAPADHFILFGNDGEKITLQTQDDTILLVLSGEPLNEPIAAGGPFVMNTHDEIAQAYRDFYEGKFGYL